MRRNPRRARKAKKRRARTNSALPAIRIDEVAEASLRNLLALSPLSRQSDTDSGDSAGLLGIRPFKRARGIAVPVTALPATTARPVECERDLKDGGDATPRDLAAALARILAR